MDVDVVGLTAATPRQYAMDVNAIGRTAATPEGVLCDRLGCMRVMSGRIVRLCRPVDITSLMERNGHCILLLYP